MLKKASATSSMAGKVKYPDSQMILRGLIGQYSGVMLKGHGINLASFLIRVIFPEYMKEVGKC